MHTKSEIFAQLLIRAVLAAAIAAVVWAVDEPLACSLVGAALVVLGAIVVAFADA